MNSVMIRGLLWRVAAASVFWMALPHCFGGEEDVHRRMWAVLPPPHKFSPPSQPRPKIVFHNHRDEPSTLYWIDPDGEQRERGVIAPGKAPQKSSRATVDRPDIVFCMADDWAWPYAGILGDSAAKIMHFDRVAAQRLYRKTLMRLRQKLDADWIKSNDPRAAVSGYVSRAVEGWPVRVSEKLMQSEPEATERALQLLAEQLRTVKRLLPETAVARLIDVPIWFSPQYEGFGPSGEYHPGAGWLANQGRHPKLHRCVEFTNIPIFEREIERMPVLVIHELAHAYHDQVLGFDHSEVRATYEIAKNNGSYDAVLRGNGKTEKAYAITNDREYFAETSEAYFGRNDFYPFDRNELEAHDPRMAKLLQKLWNDRSEP